MKAIVLKLWAEGWHEPWATAKMSAEGRLSYNLDVVPTDIKLIRITIEPYDPDSKVQMTHYGAKYTP